jgi:hypothetical protein
MESSELDHLRFGYKAAVEDWISAIREEEDLATPDHSMVAVETWERAGFKEEDARHKAKEARRRYEEALRQVLFNF